MKKIILVLLLCSFVSAPAFAQNEVTPEKKALIKEMLEVTGAKHLATAIAGHVSKMIVESSKKNQPNLDPKVLATINEEVLAVFKEEIDKDSFNQLLYPIYAKHFTVQEMKEINAFYSSPTGKKTVKTIPQVTQESMTVAQAWAKGLSPKIQERVKARLDKAAKK